MYPNHTQNTCLFKMCLLITMLSHFKNPKQFHCHYTRIPYLFEFWWCSVVLGYQNKQLQCHCIKCPYFQVMTMLSSLRLLEKQSQCHCTKCPDCFGRRRCPVVWNSWKNNFSINAPSDQIVLGLIHCNVNKKYIS